jgi:type IV fimbrial biogenesis protein FimT
MRRTAQGFTLIELLVTLGLLSAITALAAPSLLSAGHRVSLSAQAKDLQSLLNNGRSLAMVHQKSVFVCGASPGPADVSASPEPCDVHGEWRHGIHVVLDSNSNQAPDVDDDIQLFQRPYPPPTTLDWQGFRGKHHIEFLAAGITNWQNGRFTFCTASPEPQGLEVVLNAAGRSYIRPLTTPCEH